MNRLLFLCWVPFYWRRILPAVNKRLQDKESLPNVFKFKKWVLYIKLQSFECFVFSIQRWERERKYLTVCGEEVMSFKLINPLCRNSTFDNGNRNPLHPTWNRKYAEAILIRKYMENYILNSNLHGNISPYSDWTMASSGLESIWYNPLCLGWEEKGSKWWKE